METIKYVKWAITKLQHKKHGNPVKAVIGGEIIPQSTYIGKEKSLKNSDLSFHLKKI